MSETTARQQTAQSQSEAGASQLSRFISLAGLSFVLAIAGAGIAGYLTFTHFQEGLLVCNALGGCHTVQESQYATIGPVPIAALGLGMFVVLAGLALSRILRWAIVSDENALFASWAILLTGLLYFGYLTYVELFVLDAICQWCVASAIVAIAIFVTESVALRRYFLSDELD